MDERGKRDEVERELKVRYGIDPARDIKFVDLMLGYFGNENIQDIIDLAESHVETYRAGVGRGQVEMGSWTDSPAQSSTLSPVPVGGVEKQGVVEGTHSAAGLSGSSSVGIRIAAFSEYLAKIIATDQGVIRFRERFLGDPENTLAFEQAQKFVDSPAARFLPHSFFKQKGIPFTEHEAVLETYEEVREDGRRYHRAKVSIDPPGIIETTHSDNGREEVIRSLWWPQDDDSEIAQRVRVWRGSVLSELQRLAGQLARKHPWQEDQAALFILTGTTPLASTLRGGIRFSDGTGVLAHKYEYKIITLEVRDWVPAEEVAQAYRKLQREVYGGRNYRAPADRNVEVFRFVLEQSEVRIVNREEYLAKLTLPKWKEMRQAWNELYPRGHRWHYYNSTDPDARIFYRDFTRGQQAVIGTRWGLPGVSRQPMTKAEAVERARRIMTETSKWRRDK